MQFTGANVAVLSSSLGSIGDRGEVGVVVIILLLLLCCHTPAVFPLLHVGAHLARCPRAPGRAPLCCRALWGLGSLEADIKSLPKIKYLMHQLSSAQLGILHVCTLLTRNVLLSPGWPYGAMSRARSARTSTREAEYTVVCSSVSGGWIKYHISIIHFKLPAPLSPFKSIKLLFQKLLSGNFSPKRCSNYYIVWEHFEFF